MKRGAALYHIGFLLVDRESSAQLAQLADRYYASYIRGHGTLVQRRRGPGVYEYWFVPWELS